MLGRLLVLCVVGIVATSCSGTKVTTKLSPQSSKYRVQKVALVPFETMETPQAMQLDARTLPAPPGARASDISVGIPTSSGMYQPAMSLVSPLAAEKVTDLMWSKLKAKPGLTILSPNEAVRAAREVGSDASSAVPPHKIAQRLDADAALTGKVLVYQERVGSRLGANPPATVGFEVRLVAPDGVVLWEGNYYEKQRPMTEDFIGFIQRHGMFVTASELASYGATRLAEEFPFGTAAQ
jgi:hypothetical protein